MNDNTLFFQPMVLYTVFGICLLGVKKMKPTSFAWMICDCLVVDRFSGYNWRVASLTTIEGNSLTHQMQ